MKRLMDILVSGIGLLFASPVLIPTLIAVWFQDWHSPFYIAPRVGLRGKPFRMVKIRSMVIHADKSGVDSTSAADKRITAVGRFIRAYKIDEISQLWNVLIGDMSLVGPRPNVPREVALYTEEERKLLNVKPGITDIASIVFADEGDILKDKPDPDLAYHQLIRPWKSRLGLFYIQNQSLWLDIQLVALTGIAIFSRRKAVDFAVVLLKSLDADSRLISVASRIAPLIPSPPPGADQVVVSRQVA